MGKKAHSFPVDYVDIDKEKGVVTSTFKALVVGFGTTGQDALRFLYEFRLLPEQTERSRRWRYISSIMA